MSKNQFPWQDEFATYITIKNHNSHINWGDNVAIVRGVICGMDFNDSDHFLKEVKLLFDVADSEADLEQLTEFDSLEEIRAMASPVLASLLTIDNIRCAPLWDCSVEPVVEVGEVFWIAEAKPRSVQSQVPPRTLQMDAAVQVLYTTACGVFKEVLDAHPGAKVIIELRSALILCQDGTQRTTPELARRLCRAIITLLTKDSVEVPRQQGSPELSEALERMVNLLKSPNDTQWTQDEYQAVKSGLVKKEKPPIGLD